MRNIDPAKDEQLQDFLAGWRELIDLALERQSGSTDAGKFASGLGNPGSHQPAAGASAVKSAQDAVADASPLTFVELVDVVHNKFNSHFQVISDEEIRKIFINTGAAYALPRKGTKAHPLTKREIAIAMARGQL